MQHFHYGLLDETSPIWCCVQMLSWVRANLFILLDLGLSGMNAVLPEFSNLYFKTYILKQGNISFSNYEFMTIAIQCSSPKFFLFWGEKKSDFQIMKRKKEPTI